MPPKPCCVLSAVRRSGCCFPVSDWRRRRAQLGLADPGVEEVRLSPVVVRNLPTISTGPRRRVEFLIPAAAVMAELSSRNVASAEAFFDGVMGVVYDTDLFHIEGFSTEYFGGMAYLYRVVGVE